MVHLQAELLLSCSGAAARRRRADLSGRTVDGAHGGTPPDVSVALPCVPAPASTHGAARCMLGCAVLISPVRGAAGRARGEGPPAAQRLGARARELGLLIGRRERLSVRSTRPNTPFSRIEPRRSFFFNGSMEQGSAPVATRGGQSESCPGTRRAGGAPYYRADGRGQCA